MTDWQRRITEECSLRKRLEALAEIEDVERPFTNDGISPDSIANDVAAMKRVAIEQARIGQEDSTKISDAAREWWGHVSLLLQDIGRSGNDPSPLKIPFELLLVLSKTADHLRRGIVPETIAVVVGPGRPAIGPTEERHISYASAYVVAARSGLLFDPTPIKTIAELYRVSRQAVQAWAKRPLTAELSQRVERWPETLPKLVEKAGQIYSRQSTRALRARAEARQRK